MQTINTLNSAKGLEIAPLVDDADITIGSLAGRQGDINIGSADSIGTVNILQGTPVVFGNTVQVPQLDVAGLLNFSSTGVLFDAEEGSGTGEQRLGGVLMPNTTTNVTWKRLGDAVVFRCICTKTAVAGLGEFTISLDLGATTSAVVSDGIYALSHAITSGSYINVPSNYDGDTQVFMSSGALDIMVNTLNMSGVSVPITDAFLTPGAGTMVVSGSFNRVTPPP